MTYNMILSVHISPQNGCPAFLGCYQRPACPLAGVRVQNPCMLKARPHLDTPTKSSIDVTMCLPVVRGVYLGTHMHLELVQCVFIRHLELKYKQIQGWSLPLRHVERSKMIGP